MYIYIYIDNIYLGLFFQRARYALGQDSKEEIDGILTCCYYDQL